MSIRENPTDNHNLKIDAGPPIVSALRTIYLRATQLLVTATGSKRHTPVYIQRNWSIWTLFHGVPKDCGAAQK